MSKTLDDTIDELKARHKELTGETGLVGVERPTRTSQPRGYFSTGSLAIGYPEIISRLQTMINNAEKGITS